MSKPKRKQPGRTVSKSSSRKTDTAWTGQPVIWAFGVCVITAIAFLPMFSNGLTNWDDPPYVINNLLLRGPDWPGIFSESVVSNYHPLTIASLALNYQLSALTPLSYHVVNWLLHIFNTGLVFYLAYKLSDSNRWVGFITALLFGVHPMHVESVAWISERKDVLYTAFFLLSLLCYLQFIQQKGWKKYAVTILLFALSLLSKPAAVTLPVVLLLIDWYQGRSLKDKSVWLEKIPFFALALGFGVLTLQIQAEKAIALPEYYPVWQRFVFAFYGFGEYIKRLFWPIPLSAIHPFPPSGVVPVSYYPALLLVPVIAGIAWYFRKEKYILFGIGFYAVNVALVLQLLTFGNSVISERYTYVPYIGLSFALAMLWAKSKWSLSTKNIVLGLFLLMGLGFAILSNRQVHIWKNSQTLWTKAIEAYPTSYLAHANRGNDLVTNLGKFDEGLVDYTIALQYKPDHPHSLENRAIIYLHKENFPAAYADAEKFIQLFPNQSKGYFLRAFTADKMQKADQAIADYTKCIELDPKYEEARANRGVIYYNTKLDYNAAKDDFEAATSINPKRGVNYINSARCWIALRNKDEALKDIETAKQLGEKVGDDILQSLQALQ